MWLTSTHGGRARSPRFCSTTRGPVIVTARCSSLAMHHSSKSGLLKRAERRGSPGLWKRRWLHEAHPTRASGWHGTRRSRCARCNTGGAPCPTTLETGRAAVSPRVPRSESTTGCMNRVCYGSRFARSTHPLIYVCQTLPASRPLPLARSAVLMPQACVHWAQMLVMSSTETSSAARDFAAAVRVLAHHDRQPNQTRCLQTMGYSIAQSDASGLPAGDASGVFWPGLPRVAHLDNHHYKKAALKAFVMQPELDRADSPGDAERRPCRTRLVNLEAVRTGLAYVAPSPLSLHRPPLYVPLAHVQVLGYGILERPPRSDTDAPSDAVSMASRSAIGDDHFWADAQRISAVLREAQCADWIIDRVPRCSGFHPAQRSWICQQEEKGRLQHTPKPSSKAKLASG